MRSAMNWQCALQKDAMHLSLQPIRTGRISTIIFISILPLWTVRESSGISVFHGKRSAGSATVFVWNMDYPS